MIKDKIINDLLIPHTKAQRHACLPLPVPAYRQAGRQAGTGRERKKNKRQRPLCVFVSSCENY